MALALVGDLGQREVRRTPSWALSVYPEAAGTKVRARRVETAVSSVLFVKDKMRLNPSQEVWVQVGTRLGWPWKGKGKRWGQGPEPVGHGALHPS